MRVHCRYGPDVVLYGTVPCLADMESIEEFVSLMLKVRDLTPSLHLHAWRVDAKGAVSSFRAVRVCEIEWDAEDIAELNGIPW